MQNLKNKINQNINLDILKKLNFIYRSIISEEKTLEYSKKINKQEKTNVKKKKKKNPKKKKKSKRIKN